MLGNAIEMRDIFFDTAENYYRDKERLNLLWQELERAYTATSRQYHNLAHLENLYLQLAEVKDKTENWDAIMFALFYHDAVYNAMKQNNEEKSAELAQKRMQSMDVPANTIGRCVRHILATKSHVQNEDRDTNLFTDADLSILGASHDAYVQYHRLIRKEYGIYPDMIYNPGRKKALLHFLAMDRIFKTRISTESLRRRRDETFLQNCD